MPDDWCEWLEIVVFIIGEEYEVAPEEKHEDGDDVRDLPGLPHFR